MGCNIWQWLPQLEKKSNIAELKDIMICIFAEENYLLSFQRLHARATVVQSRPGHHDSNLVTQVQILAVAFLRLI